MNHGQRAGLIGGAQHFLEDQRVTVIVSDPGKTGIPVGTERFLGIAHHRNGSAATAGQSQRQLAAAIAELIDHSLNPFARFRRNQGRLVDHP